MERKPKGSLPSCTVIFSNIQALSNKSGFCLKTHEGLTHQFDFVIQQWRKDVGPRTHVTLGKLRIYLGTANMEKVFINRKDIWTKQCCWPSHFFMFDLWLLVTTDECLKCLGIRDATCVVHYGFPASPRVFGSRLSCMVENFRDLSDRVRTKGGGGECGG